MKIIGAAITFRIMLSVAQAWTPTPIQGHDYVSFNEVQSFYDFTTYTASVDTIKLVKANKILIAQFGMRELWLNNLHFYLSRPILKKDGVPMISRLDLAKVLDPVLRPDRIRGSGVQTVVLDAGHGGNDQGTSSYYGSEKIYTLDTVARLAPLLKAQGLKVAFTRTSDTWVSLEDRVLLANKNTDSIFVSIHFNAGSAARGIETYALTPLGVPSSDNKISLADYQPCEGNERDAENMALATAIHGSIMRRISLRDRGIRRARFHVLKGIAMPGVLIEGGYLGGEDAYAIAHPQYRQALAECIAKGIARYIAAVPDPRLQMQWASNRSGPPTPIPTAPMAPSSAVVTTGAPAKPGLPKPDSLLQSPLSTDAIPQPRATPQP